MFEEKSVPTETANTAETTSKFAPNTNAPNTNAAHDESGAIKETNARRDFLRRGVAATGAVIGLSVLGTRSEAAEALNGAADGKSSTQSSTTTVTTTTSTNGATAVVPPTVVAPTLQLNLKVHKELARVGGSELVPIDGDTLIVARTGVSEIVACSAICTHRGCKISYVHEEKHFQCPCHGAQFGLDGAVLRGPAKRPLKNYSADVAAVVTLPGAFPVAMPKK